jgi:hypothetical protein
MKYPLIISIFCIFFISMLFLMALGIDYKENDKSSHDKSCNCISAGYNVCIPMEF